MKGAKLERKAFAILGANHAPLHNWHPTKRGQWACRFPRCGATSPTIDDARACLPRLSKTRLLEIIQLPNNKQNATGKLRELRTLEMVLSMRTSDPAIVSARKATKEEDANGIDIVVETIFGSVFVQVKSDKANARLWRKKYAATIGPKTVLVRWDGDRIVAPADLREALRETYMRLGEHASAEATPYL
jgi:hypothetical protein